MEHIGLSLSYSLGLGTGNCQRDIGLLLTYYIQFLHSIKEVCVLACIWASFARSINVF